MGLICMLSVREQVLQVLAEKEALRLTEIHKAVLSQFHTKHSIQATKKALQVLLQEKVIEKQGLYYHISLQWILKEKAFLDQILFQKTRKKFSGIDYSANFNEFVFSTLFELDNFWNSMLLQLAKEEKHKEWIAWDNFLWFFIINMGFETSLVNDLKLQGFTCSVGALKKYPINDWGFHVYKTMGVKTFALNENNVTPEVDINIIGDSVIEVNFDKKVFKKIKNIFSKYKKIEDIPLKTIAELSTMKGKHIIKIIRSPAIAEKLRKEFHSLQKK